ncbi:MAG: hypothetical protein II388_08205, partial [Clostridia bacterium]|nr:hypothetical protein [Clostridia bacterium]
DPIVTYYNGISNDYRYRYNAFAIAVDDSASVGTQHNLNSIKGINFNAEFENGSAVKGSLTAKNITYYQRAAGSDTFNGGISDVIKENAYTVISNLNSVIITPNVIPKIVSSSLMAKFDLEIVFEDDTVIPVHTIIEKEDAHVNFDNQNNTTEALVINLAHCSSINNEDFYMLNNAIFGEKNLYDKTSKRYYVDIDSKDNVKLPMNNMSGSVSLVQTRIGDSVVYNVDGAVDFEENAISGLAADLPEIPDEGRVFRMPDGTYASEEDVHTLMKFVVSKSDMLMYDNKLYSGNIENKFENAMIYADSPYIKKLGIEFIDNGQMINGVYTGLPQTNFDQSDIDKAVKNAPEKYLLCQNDQLQGYFTLKLNADSKEKSLEIYESLKEFAESEDTPSCVKKVLDPTDTTADIDLYGSIKFYYTEGYSIRVRSSLDQVIAAFKDDGTRVADSIDFKYLSNGINTVENADMAAEGVKEIAAFLIKKFGVGIINTKETVILDIKNAEKKNVYEFLINNGVEESVGTVKSLIGISDYKYGKLGKFTEADFVPQAAATEIIDDTFVNGEISVSTESLLNNGIQKGVSYNVVNQVQVINDFEGQGLGLINVDGTDRTWNTKGYTYYSRGESIISAPVVCLNSENNGSYALAPQRAIMMNCEIVKARNTEYKWGELAFASRPDPVTDMTVDKNFIIHFNKPLDEGFGITAEGKTNVDEYLRVNTYKIKLYELNDDNTEGKLIYRTTILRDGDNETVSIPKPLIEAGKKYKVSVYAVNPLGDSKVTECELFIAVDLDIKATEDRPYYSDETVEFVETINNVSPVTLTNVIVTQELSGEYGNNDQIELRTGTSAKLPDLEPGDSFTLTYSVSASLAKDGKLVQKAEVTTAERISTYDVCEVEVIVKEPDTETEDPANDSENTDNTDNTDGINDSDNTDNSDNTDTTNDSENTDNSDNTDSINDSDNTDNSDNTDTTNDSENTDNTDNTDSTNDSENTDNSDNTDSINDSDNTDNTDNTDGANDSDNTDNTDSSNDSDNTDNTDSTNDSDNTDNTDNTSDSDTDTDGDKEKDSDSDTDNGDSDTDSDNTDKDTNSDTDSNKKDTDDDTPDTDSDNGDSDSDVTDTDSSGKNDSYTDGKETIDSPDKADSDTDTGDEPDSDSDRILPYIMGDVNIDGKVTAKDSLILQRFIIKLESINNIQMFLGDVDQDNWLRTADCINILRYVIKLHTNTVTGERVDVADSYVFKGTIG